MNIVIADDSALLREGLAGLLERRGHTVTGQAASATELLQLFDALPTLPDVLITDVRMPPNMADDGMKAAVSLRANYPSLAIMVLSQYVAPAYAVDLFAGATTAGTGYLLKDRVADVASFLQSLDIISRGGTVIDPTVASALMSAGRSGLGELTPREKEVLELMSRGLSNSEIAASLVVSGAAVAKHVSNIFMKLRLPPEEENRRVKAILEYLTAL
ncbi:Oxygen regulatory protein NreC [Corynebacterium kalinowskii]|uniref:Oxygen regulatory protein NreC n=1 Tax=Corynebacterium kalinowskii TaxID=2675216 RepID=A0A6B8VJM6_9CORY|nr:response regulator transcription factor [Corynebacterium kalinowskii]QGU03259.1 Oxygen regulatory protein NreC [Corynebacterium kalinowskii]